MHYPGQEELPQVMEEIRCALNARAVMLTLHPDDGPPVRLFADTGQLTEADFAAGAAAAARTASQQASRDDHHWLALEEGATCRDVMTMRVQRVPGHSQLMIGAFFDDLCEASRAEAVEVYLRRRPFAIGYFRLLQLHRAAVRRASALHSALDHAAMGMALLDRDGRVLFANDALDTLLGAADGLKRFNGRIQATSLDDAVRLRVAFDHVLAAVSQPRGDGKEGPATMISIERAELSPLMMLLTPAAHPPEEPADAALILYVTDPELNYDDIIDSTCKLFGLSGTEGRLARLLITGLPLGKAAQVMRIKEDTARSYLKQVFAKTGTNRQADLIRLVLSSMVRASVPPKLETFA